MSLDSSGCPHDKRVVSDMRDNSLLLRRIADLEQQLYDKDLRDDSGTLVAPHPSLSLFLPDWGATFHCSDACVMTLRAL